MAMLTHDFEPSFRAPGRQSAARPDAARAHLAVLKRFLLCALAVLVAGGAVGGVIALKTAVYFSRYHLGAG